MSNLATFNLRDGSQFESGQIGRNLLPSTLSTTGCILKIAETYKRMTVACVPGRKFQRLASGGWSLWHVVTLSCARGKDVKVAFEV